MKSFRVPSSARKVQPGIQFLLNRSALTLSMESNANFASQRQPDTVGTWKQEAVYVSQLHLNSLLATAQSNVSGLQGTAKMLLNGQQAFHAGLAARLL